MNRDPNAGQYQRAFKVEFCIAELILKPYGGTLTWGTNDYEAFQYTSEKATLLFYPHKTSGTQNVSCRVRDKGSKDKAFATELMMRLRIGSGHCNTFHQKNNPTYAEQHEICQREGLEHGWARKAVSK